MDFEERIRKGYKNEISNRGECPSAEDLIRYQQQELSTEEMLLIKKHVDVCGHCEYVIEQLSEFDLVPEQGLEEADWKESLKRFLLHPALAYGIALALLYPAYRGIFHDGSATTNVVDGTGSAMDFNLGQGSVTRSKGPQQQIVPVVLSPSERFFILTFFVPVYRDYQYEMEIRNEQEMLIDSKSIRSRDSLGNFSIVAAASLFPDGLYTMAVKEVETAKKVNKNEYNFLFRIERKGKVEVNNVTTN